MPAVLKGILLPPHSHSPIQIISFVDALDNYQMVLGGHIERISCLKFDLLVHEEEVLKNPAPVVNNRATMLCGAIRPELRADIYGPALIMGSNGSYWDSATKSMVSGYLTGIDELPMCDLCMKDRAIVDIRAFMNWAYLCGPCSVLRSEQRIGLGHGQLLVKEEEWKKLGEK